MYAPVVLSNAERFATVTFVPLGLTAFLNFPPTKRVLPHCARAYDFPFVPQVRSGALDRANAGCASARRPAVMAITTAIRTKRLTIMPFLLICVPLRWFPV